MQQVLQAYADHHGRWFKDFQRTLSLRAHDPSIWGDGVIDLVSPADLHLRAELGKTGTDLPWGGRGDLELYWRVMYAAYAEYLNLTDPGHGIGNGIRPVRDVVKHCADAYRPEILQDVIASAGHQLRLRGALPKRPEPLVRFSDVRVEDVAALVVGYGFNGKVLISRETQPETATKVEWAQDPSFGRWAAFVMPWELKTAR